MRFLRFAIVAGLASCGFISIAQSAPARFWLSTSSAAPDGPAVPQFTAIKDTTRYLHIWAQPGTVGPGDWGTTNVFRSLKSLSLDLVSDNPSVLFVDSSYTVYNPAGVGSKPRFGITSDSHTIPPDGPVLATTNCGDAGVSACLRGLQGFSLPIIDVGGTVIDFDGFGIGPTCQVGDPYCAIAGNGSPAWLLASFAVKPAGEPGIANIRLQIGANGIAHQGDDDLSVVPIVLGSDPNSTAPVYNSNYRLEHGDDPDEFPHRQVTLPLDDADAQITVAAGPAVQVTWLSDGGMWAEPNWGPHAAPSFTSNALLPSTLGNAVVVVDGAQAANHTTVQGGHLKLAAGSSLSSDVLVSGAGSISGEGWLSGDLALQGALVVDSSNPLAIAGHAVLDGAALKIGGYTQAPGSISGWIEILRANGGVQGMFGTLPGADLGGGITLKDVRYEADRILGQFQSLSMEMVGDYSRDGHVGPEDYAMWKQAFGSIVPAGAGADGNANSLIDASDYTIWRDHQNVVPGDFDRSGDVGPEDYAMWNQTFGQIITSGAGADGNGNGVVDAADYTIWRDHSSRVFFHDYALWKQTFGESVTPGSGADYNLNGVVDAADYTVIRDRDGANISTGRGFGSAVGASIPEPASCVLSLAFLVLMGTRTSFRKLMLFNH